MPDTISMLYDAAIGEEEWEDVLAAVTRHVGAHTMVFGVGSTRQRQDPELWTLNWNLEHFDSAGLELADSWDPHVNPIIPGLLLLGGRSAHIRSTVPDKIFWRSAFLQATLIKTGHTDCHVAAPFRDQELASFVLFGKDRSVQLDTEEVARLDHILPHLGRAMRLRTQIERNRSAARNLSALLEDLAYGVMLLDRHGEVVLMNARCEALRARGDGIAVIRRRPDLGPAANAAIAAALGVVDLGTGGFPSVQGVPIPRQSGLPPYLVRVYPGIGFASLAGAGAVRVAVLIDDPLDPAVLPDPALLRGLFGLTRAEAAVAQVLPRLLARRAIAEHLGISENTAKTHLAAIRGKLGARNTAEMVRILVRATLEVPR